MDSAAVRRMAVVGPGLMGLGIAHVAAAAGIEVVLVGRDAEATAAGHARLVAQLERQASRGKLDPQVAAAIGRAVQPARSDGDLTACDLAIESVHEDRGLKEAVLRRVEHALPAHAWIATNTSGLPIGGLAAALRRPERFIGLHFFSPVERMKLVEVVRGAATAAATVEAALAFVAAIGQHAILVRDGPGFYTSRVFAAYLDEALALLAEGVDAEAIEAAARANGRAMGPLAFLDAVSLRLNLQQADQARADGLEERFCRPFGRPVLERMVALGRGGRREGGGFFEEGADGRRQPWPGLATTFGRAPAQPAIEAIASRLRCAEALEALRCLEEEVITSADAADQAAVLGLGLSAERGGLLRAIEREGLEHFVHACEGFAASGHARFRPSPWLRRVVAAGRGLDDWRDPTPSQGATS